MYSKFVELMRQRNLKFVDISKATGIPASTFSDWKKGKSKPKVDKLQKIANFFGVPVTEFLESEVEK